MGCATDAENPSPSAAHVGPTATEKATRKNSPKKNGRDDGQSDGTTAVDAETTTDHEKIDDH